MRKVLDGKVIRRAQATLYQGTQMKAGSGAAISKEVAEAICSEIQKEKGRKLFSQCWGCVKFSKGDPAKMCFNNKIDNRGCTMINARFDSQ